MMKFLTAALSCVGLLQYVAAQGAHLYTVDRKVMSSSTAMIDSEMASAIISRRRALTEDRYLGITNEMLLQDIDAYGGHQAPLFANGKKTDAPGKLFIRITGVDLKINDLDAAMPDLWIQEPTKDLLTDFKAVPSRQEKDNICEYIVPPSLNTPNAQGVEVVFSYPLEDEKTCLAASEIPNTPVIMTLHGFLPSKPSEAKSKLGSLIRILKHFSATENVESTLLFLPSKLSAPSKSHHNRARAAQETEEERLDLPSSTAALVFDTLASSNASDNFTLPSVIPQCFSSQSSCENTTNFCSGRGNCYRAHTNCFKCRCGTTIAHVNQDGTKKTTQWGGAACERKDISIPFILFASFGIAMTALISGAIGMLYSMGSQELPSVIGAGVAGPKAGK
ncbi:hypothetical protein EDD36DRAFT_434490 [Exophiala viscosa]|uniref:Vacuolar sorting protein Vps3844 C-terminal domain-containing protein n=1 Tax=Exophiala viscosa TaxID=2486360 RepID=A0AAN6DWZ9_9EURO|nr:hypothetical protein EDD36DRAFT_434490 [Exophiala viscosa]